MMGVIHDGLFAAMKMIDVHVHVVDGRGGGCGVRGSVMAFLI